MPTTATSATLTPMENSFDRVSNWLVNVLKFCRNKIDIRQNHAWWLRWRQEATGRPEFTSMGGKTAFHLLYSAAKWEIFFPSARAFGQHELNEKCFLAKKSS